MEILTIYNYVEESDNYKNLLYLWLKQIKKYNDLNLKVKVFSYFDEPDFSNEIRDELEMEYIWEKRDILNTSSDVFFNTHDIRFKMFNLTNYKTPYVYIEVDAFLFENISVVIKYSSHKPWIGINHQKIPDYTEKLTSFLNTSVQVVSDHTFINMVDIIRNVQTLECSGFDQAMLFSFFDVIKYDYTHSVINHTWNFCAGYTKYDEKNEVFYTNNKCVLDHKKVAKEIVIGEKVNIIHYWDEFKPWDIKCKFFEQNKFFK